MSASKRATLTPKLTSVRAIPFAMVDLPTPPFPEAIAIIFLTPEIG